MEVNEYRITIVSCGPGSADYVMPIAHKAVAKAEVLVGASRLLKLFPDSMAKRIIVTGHIEEVLEQIELEAKNKSVAVLVSGDAGLFSLAKSVISKFGRERCRVIPGVSSVQVAFARAGLSWEDVKIISAHHKLPEVGELNFEDFPKIAVLAGHKNTKPWLVEQIQSIKVDVDVFVCENLTLENETVRRITAKQLAQIEFGSRAIILIVSKEIS